MPFPTTTSFQFDQPHQTYEYSSHETMSQNHLLPQNSQHRRPQNIHQHHSASSVLHQNSQFYLDPTVYFDPAAYSQIPNNGYSQYPAGSSLPAVDEPEAPRRKTRLRASRACIPCRSRHMKCDSIEPTCTRCQTEAKTCEYAKSRRGGLNRIVPNEQESRGAPPSKAWTRDTDSDVFIAMDARSLDNSRSPNEMREGEPPTTEKLIAKYYDNFAHSHPIILPRRNLLKRLLSDPDSLRLLLPMMELISSIYQPNLPSEPYVVRAEAAVAFSESALELPRTGFTVQAFVLLSMARHCSNDYDAGHRYLNCAVDVALSIGMHRRSFAVDHGEGDAVLEESWRRTWWMVNTLDANYAGMWSEETHRLKGIVEEVDLPCEDAEYESGQIPSTHRTIQEYDNREFLPTGIQTVFSSFTYKIDAARIFSQNLPFCSSKSTKEKGGEAGLAAADARCVNWFLYLPRCKQKMVKDDGRVDETMFSAVLFINSQKLLLHRPHSHLLYHAIESTMKRTPSDLSPRNPALHTAVCMEALTATISLFALPLPSLKFSPIMAWALSLAILAQVSACIHILKPGSEEYIAARDRIKLGLGAMRVSMDCWYSACKGVTEVIEVARALLAVGGGRNESVSESTDDDGSLEGSVGEYMGDIVQDMVDEDVESGYEDTFAGWNSESRQKTRIA